MRAHLSTVFRSIGPALLALAAPACGDDGGAGGGPPGPSGTFFVSGPATLTVRAGDGGTIEVTVTRAGGFAEPITLTLENHPGDLTHDAPTASGETRKVALTFTTAVTMAPGTYPVRMCGNATGMTPKCTAVDVTVTPGPIQAFALTLVPATLSVRAGQKATVAITLTRAVWFDEPVTLDIACWCDPPGVTFTFDPAVIPGGANTATATVTVAANAPPFVYTGEDQLWIVGISPSGRRYDAIFHLTVTPP